MPMRTLLLVLLALARTSLAAPSLETLCPGNLLQNGGFEEPNTAVKRSEVRDPSNNSRWGWYLRAIPGWYTTRPDGKPCARVDWQKPYIEVARNALATAPEGMQYGELLPNATGVYCQDVPVRQGQRYRLTFQYGRLMTFAKNTQTFTVYETAADALYRPASYTPSNRAGKYPTDPQGFTKLVSMDTRKHAKQWQEYSATFVAPTNKVTIAFINTLRPKSCGACGSLLDAVCLRPA